METVAVAKFIGDEVRLGLAVDEIGPFFDVDVTQDGAVLRRAATTVGGGRDCAPTGGMDLSPADGVAWASAHEEARRYEAMILDFKFLLLC